jgi:hypothetical protein
MWFHLEHASPRAIVGATMRKAGRTLEVTLTELTSSVPSVLLARLVLSNRLGLADTVNLMHMSLEAGTGNARS